LSALPEIQNRFTHREVVLILAGLILGMFLASLDQTIMATALPRMARDLNGIAHLSWIISAYLLTSTAVTPIYGKLSDLYGRKPMLQIAIAIFLLTSILCGLAASMNQLIFCRALQGLGGGGLISMAHATIADVISPRERGRYQAYIASSFAVASVIGPVLGGLFVDYLTWRWVFWINVPIGLGALAMAQYSLRRLIAKRTRHKIDYPGALLIVASVCCVLLVTTMGGNEFAWDSTQIRLLAGGAVALFLATILQERLASEPILPLRLFANRTFLLANLINLLTSIGIFGAIIFIPLYLQLVYGLAAGDSGFMLIPFTAAMIAAAIMTGRLMSRTGRTKIFPLIGTILTCAGMACMSFLNTATPLALSATVIAVAGMGIGLVNPVMMVAIQNDVEVRDLGTATSSISFFRSMGGSFGVALYTAVLIARLNSLVGALPGADLFPSPGTQMLREGAQAVLHFPTVPPPLLAAAIDRAFHDVFRMGAAITFLTFIAVLLLKERPLKTETRRD